MNICIIPGRGGSQRIPKKNIKEFHGKPIIAYSIEVAKESGLFDHIIVSTEDKEIAEVAESFGASVVWRPEELSENDVGTQEVAKCVIEQIEWSGQVKIDYACVIYPCSPMLSARDIIRGFGRLITDMKAFDYAVSVGTEPLHDAGNFYWGRGAAFRTSKPLFGAWTRMFPLPKERVCDINTPEDFARAEKMYEALHEAD